MDAVTSKPDTAPVMPADIRADTRPVAARPSRAEAEAAVRTLIAYAGDDPAREGLIDTPRRVVAAYDELFGGYHADPVDVLEQQDLGEEVLTGGALFELPHGLVADFHQLLAREGVLVLLDALQQELLVLLLERARRPPGDSGARLAGETQHGSTCTVTSWNCRSRLSRSSTSSAIACADSTLALRSTAIVTSA